MQIPSSYLTNHAVTYLQFIWITGESYEKGIAFFTNRIRRYPSEVLAYNYRAAHLWYSAQQSEALLDYSRALELAPDDLWALLSRGQAYVEVKQPEKAVEDLNRALQMLNAVPNVREQNRSEAQAYARNGLGTHGLCSETLVARFENLIFRWTFSRKRLGLFKRGSEWETMLQRLLVTRSPSLARSQNSQPSSASLPKQKIRELGL